ncbi:MAG: kelch repeat-containing protein [Candidatus Wallbacteria bacterium]|nr:kelch repeat-containing protein [Candidatus Wallbacteria bacterium]
MKKKVLILIMLPILFFFSFKLKSIVLVLLNLGESIFHGCSSYETASMCYELEKKIDPKHFRGYKLCLLGNCYFNLHDYKKASLAFREALNYPDYRYYGVDTAKWFLGESYYRMGSYECAVEVLSSVAKGNTQVDLAYCIYKTGQIEKGIDGLKTYVQKTPYDPHPHELLIKIYLETGQHGKAKEEYEFYKANYNKDQYERKVIEEYEKYFSATHEIFQAKTNEALAIQPPALKAIAQSSESISVKNSYFPEAYLSYLEINDPILGKSHASMIGYNRKLWILGGMENIDQGNTVNFFEFDSKYKIWWKGVVPDEFTFPRRYDHCSVIFQGRLVVIGGCNENGNQLDDVWSSADGFHWNCLTRHSTFGPRSDFGVCVHNDALFLIGGTDGKILFNDIWRSTDGINWVSICSNAPFEPFRSFGCTTKAGRIIVAGGINDEGNPISKVWSSADGVSWEQACSDASFGERFSPYLATFNDVIYLIGGYGGHFEKGTTGELCSDIWKSADSIRWEKVTGEVVAGNSRTCASLNNKIQILGPTRHSLNSNFWSFSPDTGALNPANLELPGFASADYSEQDTEFVFSMPTTCEVLLHEAEKGSVEAMTDLGVVYYQQGENNRKYYKDSFYWLKKAADKNQADAQYYLGELYYSGSGTSQNTKEAFVWFQRSAEQGNVRAQCKMGLFCENGYVQPRDIKKAVGWYEKAVTQNDPEALYLLATVYTYSNEVMYDSKKAIELCTRAAEKGFPKAQSVLANLFYYSKTPQHYENALKWYLKLAKGGNAFAEHMLSVMYYSGQGAPENPEAAVKWAALAARHGNVMAQGNLGIMYEYGTGVPKDLKKAEDLYRLAAEQGNELSQFHLGSLYADGKGLKQDFCKAYAWTSLAVAHGCEDAVKVKNETASKITRMQTTRIDKQAVEWKPKVKVAESSVNTNDNLSYFSDNESDHRYFTLKVKFFSELTDTDEISGTLESYKWKTKGISDDMISWEMLTLPDGSSFEIEFERDNNCWQQAPVIRGKISGSNQTLLVKVYPKKYVFSAVILPLEAYDDGVRWKLKNEQRWRDNSETVEIFGARELTVEFNLVNDWKLSTSKGMENVDGNKARKLDYWQYSNCKEQEFYFYRGK